MNTMDVSIQGQSSSRIGGLVVRIVIVALLMAVVVLFVVPPVSHAAGDANQSSCPSSTETSPGFRESLPDCRAYELVSPPFADGQPAFPEALAASGESLSFHSLGAFGDPGNDTSLTAGFYVGDRGVSGWSAAPINPSASEFQGFNSDQEGGQSETIDLSGGLEQSLFLQAPVGAKPVDARFYVRDTSDGAFVEVGPLISPEAVAAWTPSDAPLDSPRPKYVGAAKDFEHIFFNLREDNGQLAEEPLAYLWPGDESANKNLFSLYEYSGVGNAEPELVGVRNAGSLAGLAREEGKPHINEAAEQISRCSDFLGGEVSEAELKSADVYNAISVSGETVFFTAYKCSERVGEPVVNEVFARVGRERTVAISEPSKEDCEVCETYESEPEKRSRGIFQGANEEGTKAFFLSEQALISGADGLQPEGDNLYEYSFDPGAEGRPSDEKVSLLAADMPASGGVVRVSENGTFVYLVSESAKVAELADNQDALGETAKAGADNLYVYDTVSRVMTFIGALSSEDQRDWSTQDDRPVQATPDGRFLLFRSAGDLTPGAAGPGMQLYRYEVPSAAAPAGTLVRVTIGEDGFNDNGNSVAAPGTSVFAPTYKNLLRPLAEIQSALPAAVDISSDGSRVFFASPVALTRGALSDVCAGENEGCVYPAENVYEWVGGQVYLISDGRDTHTDDVGGPSTFLFGADPSGDNVFFGSADSLVPQATATQESIYDARVDGGFPGPSVPPGCAGETCQAPPGVPPSLGVPGGTAIFTGPGNLVPAAEAPFTKATTKKAIRCKKGLAEEKGKCVKSRRSKRAKRAVRNGRTGR
jgi:hypothetical protein